jgi:hypothetical protein
MICHWLPNKLLHHHLSLCWILWIYATFLSILFASNVTPAVISSASSPSSSTTKTRLPQLYRINKQDARKFLKEFLLKSSIRMSSGSKIPQFYLDKSFRGSFDLLSNSMSLEKRLDLIESLVSECSDGIFSEWRDGKTRLSMLIRWTSICKEIRRE